MKTRFTWLGIVAACIFTFTALFIGCNGDLNDVVLYRGQVVYINTTTPFADLTVKVTDGQNTHCQTQTDAGGNFSLKVRVNEIDGNYYLLAGDSTCVPKKVSLGGYGQAEVDLGVIEVEGPALPTVKTDSIKIEEVTADGAIIRGEVLTDGRLAVTARGVCYGTNPDPVIDGLHTAEGSGLGAFTSTLKDLEHNTIYYARAYATNKMGTAYGEQVKFTTELGVPIVITDSVIRITAHSAKCKGHVESDGGYAVSKKGTCWSRQPDPTVDGECTNDGSGKGEFTSTLSGLLENTTYYVRTYATNATATVYGEQIIITTLDGLAVVKTDSLNNITATGCTAFGTVVSDCDIPVIERGFCYSTSQYPTIEDSHIASGKGLGDYKSNITKLEYGTTYYVRAYATNETGTTYGDQVEITTLSGLPTVTTDSVSNIGSVKATCGGNVTDDGTLTVTARGVCYGTEPQPTIEDTHTTDGKGTGKFVSNLKNLSDKTTYYIRAYATTAAGTAYGEQRTFKTENGIPVVLLSEVGEPTANSVTCKGNVMGDGGVTITERGFCYGLTQYPTNKDAHIAIGNGVGEFSGSITKLNINTTYYVRAYAVNSLGIGYSEQKSFTTKNGLPTVTTSEPSATATTITVGGNITDNGGYAVSDRGVCYSASNSEPTITEEKVSGGKGNGEFSVTITKLVANTTYHLRAYATNENGTTYGKSVTIKTKDGNASVSLGEITDITALTASASVTVTDAGSATLLACGICWSTNPNPTTDNNKTEADGKSLNTAYKCNLSGLTANQKYYVRAYATTDATTTYSEQLTFLTKDGAATLSLSPVSNITALTASAMVTVTAVDGANLQACGICWSTVPNPTIENHKTTAEGKQLNTAYVCNMTKLQPNTTYYVRGYATTVGITSYSNQQTFKTSAGLPDVKTWNIYATTTSITVYGEITDNGGYGITERGFCYSKINSEPTTSDSKIENGSGIGAFQAVVQNLEKETTYYVRAYATNIIGTAYGNIKTITTKNGLATVNIGDIKDITALFATSSISVTDDGGASLLNCGICWSKTPNPTIANSKTVADGKQLNTTYICNMSELQPSTTYYVRGYATTDIATAYSTQKSFTTTVGLPAVSTGTATSSISSITITGEIIDNGGYNISERGFCYSKTNSEPTIQDSKVVSGSGIGAYSASITSLEMATNYYVRAFATNEIGTSYGKSISVATGNGMASLSLEDINSITTNAAYSAVTVTGTGGATLENCGICWSTNPNPTIDDAKTVAGGTSLNKAYTCKISNLLSGTTYNVRAYATTNITTVYSAVKTFTTLISVSGVVKNESGQAIPNATIMFKKDNTIIKSTTSNATGNFSLQMASGSYNIETTANGYEKLSQNIYVDTKPLEIVMKQLGVLFGTVYDDDNIPLANAKISVKSSSNTTFSTISNSDGTYRIENIPLGQTSNIDCILSGYKLTAIIPNKNINSGNNNLDIKMYITTPTDYVPSSLTFDCTNEGMCGTTVTKTLQITNNRQKAVSWSLSGVPAKGIVFSPSNGTIQAKSSITILATFTYPGSNVQGSVKTSMHGCVTNGYTYLWNWSDSGIHWNNVCIAYCSQDIKVIVGNEPYNINLWLWQTVVWK